MKPLRVVAGVIALIMIASGTLITRGPSDEPLIAKPVLAMIPSSWLSIEARQQDALNGADGFTIGSMPVPISDMESKLGSKTVARNPWIVTVQPGQTLDGLLGDAGLGARVRVGIAAALTDKYDVRRIRPGHRLTVEFGADGSPKAMSLAVDDGVLIDVELGGTPVVRKLLPTASWVDEAREFALVGSLYTSFDRAAVPVRFAVEMARLLRETIDVRRDFRGGERLRVLWSRQELEDGSPIGSPRLSYMALDAVGSRIEIVWSQENLDRTSLYVDGEILRSFLVPAEGGRLSSAFGPRKHPIFANVRLHTGVDFAADFGAPIVATASGEVSFIGWRSGYGRVVEIAHGSDQITRYAHLSAVTKGLALGDRVSAGAVIGEVGETGTTTSPNLHYEVRVDDQPVDPLQTIVLSTDVGVQDTAALLASSRSRFAAMLVGDSMGSVSERL